MKVNQSLLLSLIVAFGVWNVKQVHDLNTKVELISQRLSVIEKKLP